MGKKLKKNLGPETPETPATIYFEVAPDPDDRVLAAKWRGLSHTRKPIITRRAALAVVPKALETLKLEGEWDEVVGGYLGETNPCLAVRLACGARAVEFAKLLGHVCAQQSMMIASDYPQRDLEMLDLFTIKLPNGFTTAEIATLYERLWRVRWRWRGLVSGHSTHSNEMRILNTSGAPTGSVARHIATFLNDKYRVSTGKAWATLISKERYADREEGGMIIDERRVAEWRGYLRWKVESILKNAFETERRGRRL
jgi:hypothetical protein